jgi:hypothetical protein
VGIASVTEYYALNNSTTAPDDSSFSTGVKTPTATNKYVWNYELITYTDNTTSKTEKHIAATYGDTGATGNGISSIVEYYAVNNSTTAPADSAFSTTISAPTAANKYLWNYEQITYTDGSTVNTGKRVIGTYGEKGDTGSQGATGIGVSAVVEQYYLSTSNTTQSGGSWSTSQPEWVSGKYIWTRSQVTWTNNTTTYTTPVLAKAINGANSAASSAQSAVTTLDSNLDQQGVFNRLTNNGQTQGIYLNNGLLYINASYIQAGDLSASRIKGGTLTLGGSNNINGTLTVKNGSGNTVGEWNNNGITVYYGALNISYIRQYYDDTYYFDQNGFVSKRVANKGLPSERTSTISITGEAININTQGTITREISIKSQYAGDPYEMGISPSKGINWTVNGNDFIFVTPQSTGLGTGVILYTDFIVASGNTKSKVISTDQYADRLLYCYETPSPMYGDVGEAIIGDDGLCYVTIDPIFAQTITTDNYQVFLQRYGAGDCWVQDRKGGWFVVAGTPGLAFGWEIKGKQADIADVGLRRLDRNDEKFTVPTQTYGEDAANHIDEIRKEREAA